MISSSQNVAVHYIGDGPLIDLTYTFTVLNGGHVDVDVTDASGAAYASLSNVAIGAAGAHGVLDSAAFTQAAVREVCGVCLFL